MKFLRKWLGRLLLGLAPFLCLLMSCATVSDTTTTTSSTATTSSTTTSSTAATTTSTTTTSTTTTTLAAVEFTHHITDLTLISFIIPPGSRSGDEISPHSYLSILTTEATVEVNAPVGAELSAIGYYTERSDAVPEYSLWFKVNSNVYYFFDHLVKCSPKIEAVAPATPRPDSTTVPPTSPVSVSAGEFIASAEGTLQARTFDFGAYDASHANPVANASRYSATNRYVTGINPYTYYPTSLRTQYLNKVGIAVGTLNPTTECRSPCRDVLGTAAGYWYLDSGTDATYTTNLPLLLEVDGSVRWGGVGGGGIDQNSSPDPVAITTGESQAYTYSGNYLYIKLLDANSLGVSYGSGAPPASFPASYKTYVR